jgi:hypothetical protein
MPRGCDYSVRIDVDVSEMPGLAGRQPRTGLRKFIVEFDSDGEVLRIKEVKQLQPPSIGIYHAQFWKAGTHALGNGDTLPKRVIAAAAAKMAAEDGNADATP